MRRAEPDRWTKDQRALVERARRGDHDAFAGLARMHVARLDAAARLILRDHDLARARYGHDGSTWLLDAVNGGEGRQVDWPLGGAITWGAIR